MKQKSRSIVGLVFVAASVIVLIICVTLVGRAPKDEAPPAKADKPASVPDRLPEDGKKSTVAFETAMQNNWVSIKTQSAGPGCVTFRFDLQREESFRLHLDVGTIIKGSDPAASELAMANERAIPLKDDSQRKTVTTVLLSLKKPTPDYAGEFQFAGKAPEPVIKVLQAAMSEFVPGSDNGRQLAVWMVAEDITLDDMDKPEDPRSKGPPWKEIIQPADYVRAFRLLSQAGIDYKSKVLFNDETVRDRIMAEEGPKEDAEKLFK